MAGSRTHTDMTQGTIWKQILFFSIPLLVGNLFQQLYNTVDTIVVGNFLGRSALAAVSSSTSLINLIIGLFIGTATGAGVVIAQFYGAGKLDKVEESIHTSMALSIIGGVALIGIGILLSPVLLRAMDTPETVMPNSTLYFRVYFTGSLFNLFYNMGAGVLRALGDSRRPLYYLCVASVVNIILDVLFVAGFHMGVEGAGLATVIAQGVSAVLVFRALHQGNEFYSFRIKKIHLHSRMVGRILALGIPNGLQTCIISLSNVVVQANINVFGDAAMAGCGSFFKIDGFLVMPCMSLSLASMTFAGQNIGAGRLDRVKKGVLWGTVITVTYSAITTGLMYLFGNNLLEIFSREPEVLSYARSMMYVMVPFYWMVAISQVHLGAFRGTGKSIMAMVIAIGNMCVVRMIWIAIMVPITGDIRSVFWGYPVSWITLLLCCRLYYHFGSWKKIPSAHEKKQNSIEMQ